MSEAQRKPRLVVQSNEHGYWLEQENGEWQTLPVFKAAAPIDLVLAVTRHRNPQATVYAIDPQTGCIRIH